MQRSNYGFGVVVKPIEGAGFAEDDIGVYVHGKLVRKFNSLSDDYAYTNANECALRLSKQEQYKDASHGPA